MLRTPLVQLSKRGFAVHNPSKVLNQQMQMGNQAKYAQAASDPRIKKMMDTVIPVHHNFNPGPAVMPQEVLEKVQKDLLDFKGLGLSVMEMSHRQPEFISLTDKLIRDYRDVMQVPDNFHVFLAQGGATLQFSAIPYNLAPEHMLAGTDGANFLVSGEWTRVASRETEKFVGVNRVNPVTDNYIGDLKAITDYDSWKVDKNAAYFQICQNETIEGVEFDQKLTKQFIDRVRLDAPDQIFVSDMSSVLGARNLSKEGLWDEYGVIFSGAHKNFGTSGLTFIMVRDDVMDQIYEKRKHSKLAVPMIMDWTKYHEVGSAYYVNTPTMLTIKVCSLMCEYMLQQGGVDYFEHNNVTRADKIYDVIEASKLKKEQVDPSDSGAFSYNCTVPKALRSTMNQAFTIDCRDPAQNQALMDRFVDESRDLGLLGLKGHVAVGGLRSTTYNSLPNKSVDVLCEFMENFLETR